MAIGNAGGRFEERVELVAGPNRIEMQATDRVGNTGIERWQISLDQDPPELAGQRVEPKQVEKGGRLTVEVTARDRSGLRQAAQVEARMSNGPKRTSSRGSANA